LVDGRNPKNSSRRRRRRRQRHTYHHRQKEALERPHFSKQTYRRDLLITLWCIVRSMSTCGSVYSRGSVYNRVCVGLECMYPPIFSTVVVLVLYLWVSVQ
jgi:hypothetical protein